MNKEDKEDMDELRTDASPIPEVRTSEVENDDDDRDSAASVPSPNGNDPATPTKKMPQTMHLSGCSKVHIGPLYNCINPASVRTPPPGATSPIHSFVAEFKKAPPTAHVEALLRSKREVSDAELNVLSNHLGHSWRQLGLQMKYSEGQLDNIDADHRRLVDKAYALLSQWRDRESRDASVDSLVRLLMPVRAYDVVMRLRP